MKLQKQHTNFLAFVVFALVSCLVFPSFALAEFRSVSVPKAILYDAPSPQGNKLFILSQGYPVEVVVVLADWIKVRDKQGALSWIEVKQLSSNRTLLIAVNGAEVKQTPEITGVLVGRLEKDVVVDFVEPAKAGWVKIKHRDGLTGFIQTSAVWGF
jgi:SH3-like domain-containing protein